MFRRTIGVRNEGVVHRSGQRATVVNGTRVLHPPRRNQRNSLTAAVRTSFVQTHFTAARGVLSVAEQFVIEPRQQSTTSRLFAAAFGRAEIATARIAAIGIIAAAMFLNAQRNGVRLDRAGSSADGVR